MDERERPQQLIEKVYSIFTQLREKPDSFKDIYTHLRTSTETIFYSQEPKVNFVVALILSNRSTNPMQMVVARSRSTTGADLINYLDGMPSARKQIDGLQPLRKDIDRKVERGDMPLVLIGLSRDGKNSMIDIYFEQSIKPDDARLAFDRLVKTLFEESGENHLLQ